VFARRGLFPFAAGAYDARYSFRPACLMNPRLIVPLLFLSAVLPGCKREAPVANPGPDAVLQQQMAEVRKRADEQARQLSDMRERLLRTEAALDEANRRLVRVKVENAKLRQELTAVRRQNGH